MIGLSMILMVMGTSGAAPTNPGAGTGTGATSPASGAGTSGTSGGTGGTGTGGAGTRGAGSSGTGGTEGSTPAGSGGAGAPGGTSGAGAETTPPGKVSADGGGTGGREHKPKGRMSFIPWASILVGILTLLLLFLIYTKLPSEKGMQKATVAAMQAEDGQAAIKEASKAGAEEALASQGGQVSLKNAAKAAIEEALMVEMNPERQAKIDEMRKMK